MRLLQLLEERNPYLYHATFNKNIPGILKKGIRQFETSNWIKGEGGKRYNEDAGIFAFEHPEDAFRWALKMEWDFQESDISIVRFNYGGGWEQDPSADVSLAFGKGKSMRSHANVSPEDIIDVFPIQDFGKPGTLGIGQEEWFNQVTQKLTESQEEYANQAVKMVLQDMDWSGGDGEWLWNEYFESTGDERDPEKVSVEDPQVAAWFENLFAERVYDKEDDIRTFADWDGNEIMIYREITASEDWLSSAEIITDALGIFWSWDKNAAEAHWGSFGSGDVHWLIVSKVPKGRVNWPSTLAKNASFSQEEEKEIEVMEGTPLPLLAVYAGGIHGTEVDLGALKGKKFPA